MLYKVCCTFRRSVLAGIFLLLISLPAHASLRDDVLIIVNDNSLDSPRVGAYYAQQRGINPANIVHINVPDSYFISWDDFRRLRDQLIRFMQLNTLDDPALTPEVCLDGEPPFYCTAAMDQLRAHTRIRYLVTTRGVPTRMTVDGSTLYAADAPTSVDNYLKYWLINYFADDVKLLSNEREIDFGDGRGMRTVQPDIDRELIVGRIDGLNLDASLALVDRTLAVEGAGIYGSWYGSTKFWSLKNARTGSAIYPKSDRSILGWRYALGLWGEDRAECRDYLNFSGLLAEGKAPAHCRVKFNDDSDPAMQATLGISYPAPGAASSRMPRVIDALGYQGWLDGQATLGSFETLLNWRKNDQCAVTLCDNAADPAACRASSSDIFGEINTDCVGVADGFMGYNHTSYPVSYLTIWPTSWFQSDRTGNSGWNHGGHGDLNHLAFPEVRSDEGFDDSSSLWFRNTDQVASPLCYIDSNFSVLPSVPCFDQRRLVLSQKITLAAQTLDINSPQSYRVSLRYKTLNFANNTDLQVRLFIHETGAGDVLIDYGVKTLAVLTPVDSNGWVTAEVLFTLDPLLHSASSYDGIKVTFDTANAFAGDLGIDLVSVQESAAGQELVSNGSFSQGHRQAASGDHAATFLNRLGGVAAWGSVGHHQSAGAAFAFNGLESMTYFLRGLPLGDAVWFNESNNSGILYGDPLYSPVAVKIDPINACDTLVGVVELFGSTVNGREPAKVSTSYQVDVCPGDDFLVCDHAQNWSSTGINGTGGGVNQSLGSWDSSTQAPGSYVLRLAVTSVNSTTGRSQTLNDYYPVKIASAPPGLVAAEGSLQFSEPVYSVAENGTTAVITVTRLGVNICAASVDYSTSDSSATAGSDYTAVSGTINFADGDAVSKTFSVPVLDDTTYEGDETVSLTLSNVSGAGLGSLATAILTITEDETVPPTGSLQLSASMYIVNESDATAVVTVMRVGGSLGAVSVDYATSDSSATAGSDYTAVSGTLDFADGELSQTIVVPVLNDNLVEGEEILLVSLSNPAGGTGLSEPMVAALIIVGDDVATADMSNTSGSSNPMLLLALWLLLIWSRPGSRGYCQLNFLKRF
jgi:uncharacterized protein (TIGR03790 family)